MESEPLQESDLRRLKVQLSFGSADEKSAAISEIVKGGEKAIALIPLILKLYKQNDCTIGEDHLLSMYNTCSSDKAILDDLSIILRTRSLSIYGTCQLIRWGVPGQEQLLLTSLWNNYSINNMWRQEIVEALAVGGSNEALDVFHAILVRMEKQCAEKRNSLSETELEQGNPDEVVEALSLSADFDFLQLLKESIVALERRLSQDS